MPTFSVTWDYLCPFARNAHEHLATALLDGAPWEVTSTPFCLMQTHVEEGDAPVWTAPEPVRGVLALQVGLVVRDRFPDQFLDVHIDLFAARHDRGLDIGDRGVLTDVLTSKGVAADVVWDEIDGGDVMKRVQASHETAVQEHEIFGVPTFVQDDQAVFVRIMTRPEGDAKGARRTIEGVLALLASHPELNEYKHTTVAR